MKKKLHPPMFLPLAAEAWISIGTNRVRALLAMLGIIIGVGSVVLMVAVGAGSRQRVEKAINSLGNNLLIVTSGARDLRGIRQNTQPLRFTVKDVDAIAQLPSVEAVAYSTNQSNLPASSAAASDATNIFGAMPDFFYVRNWVFEEGDNFLPDDMRRSKRVAIVGATVAAKFFPGGNATGKSLLIGEKKLAFLIIGVLQPKGASLDGRDQDDVVFVPATAFKAHLSPYMTSPVQMIYVKVARADLLEDTGDDITTLLRQSQKIPASMGDNFTVRNLNAITKVASDTTAALSMLLGAIASISLLVGSIGIMNIMLVTVSERTREIGIRKAIGATEGQILLQFLLEAVMISAVGSVIGLGLGWGGGLAAERFIGIPVAYSLWSVAMALLMAGGIGVASGLYPAHKAAKMEPIEALRAVG